MQTFLEWESQSRVVDNRIAANSGTEGKNITIAFNPCNRYRRTLTSSKHTLILFLASIVLCFACCRTTLAEETIVSGKFLVIFSATNKQKVWIAKAMEQNIYNDLAGYGRVIPFYRQPAAEEGCRPNKVECLLERYRSLKVDALMLGQVSPSRIEFQVYDVQKKSLVKTGSIPAGAHSSLLELRMGAFNAFKSFLGKGGILDQRQFKFNEPNASDVSLAQKTRIEPNAEQYVLFALIALTLTPYVLSFLGKHIRHPDRSHIISRCFYPFSLTVFFACVLYVSIELAKDNHQLKYLMQIIKQFEWVLTGIGGLLWGYFLVKNLKLIMPLLQGIERLNQSNLTPLLRSYLFALTIKCLFFFSIYASYFYSVFHIGNMLGIRSDVILVILLPVSGLYLSYWAALMLEVLAMCIDMKITTTRIDYHSLWHIKTKKYFISYLKRNGISLKKTMVDDIVFLAGKNPGVVCYGGAFTRPRIVINEDLIKFGIGEKSEDIAEVVRPTITHTSELHFSPLCEQSSSNTKKSSRHTQKQKSAIQDAGNRIAQYFTNTGPNKIYRNDSIIQGLILANFKKPDDIPALMCDSMEDMNVLSEWVTQSKRLSYAQEESEIDDSSDEDKDFLFGILLQKAGVILRYDQIYSTILLFFKRKYHKSGSDKKLFFMHSFTTLADTFVALNFGLDHLIQYLYFRMTNKKILLTTRATSKELLKNQNKILGQLGSYEKNRVIKRFYYGDYERMLWLSNFSHQPIEKKTNTRIRKMFKWSFSLGMAGLTLLAFNHSYDYHPEYLETIENEKKAIAEAIQKAKQKEEEEANKRSIQ